MSSYQLLSKWVKEHSIPLDLELYIHGPDPNPTQKMTGHDMLRFANAKEAEYIGQFIANQHNQIYLQQGGDVKKRLQAKLAKKKAAKVNQ